MKNIKIADMTLCQNTSLSFKERIETARLLEKLGVNSIELPVIENIKSDTLLIRTISSFVKESTISVCGGYSEESVGMAAAALSAAKKGEIRIELPLSPVGMEYTLHKKAPQILELVSKLISVAKQSGKKVQFCAIDATRAEESFLIESLNNAITAGADSITICDTAACLLPDEFAKFVSCIVEKVPATKDIDLCVCVENKNGMAAAACVLAIKEYANTVKTSVSNEVANLETIATLIKNCGNNCGFECGIKHTETGRIIKQITRITTSNATSVSVAKAENETVIQLDANDDRDVVAASIESLGYDLSDEDIAKVYEEFKVIAAKKRVGAKELDAIIASVALQVPPTYKLISYVINNGNIISSSAQIRISKDGEEFEGICIGDGPVDAAFRAVEQIIGRHYELDDFQIQTVTEGKDSMGSALVKLRENGKLYSGTGISTDILGASIRAYINALNKIVYEEEN